MARAALRQRIDTLMMRAVTRPGLRLGFRQRPRAGRGVEFGFPLIGRAHLHRGSARGVPASAPRRPVIPILPRASRYLGYPEFRYRASLPTEHPPQHPRAPPRTKKTVVTFHFQIHLLQNFAQIIELQGPAPLVPLEIRSLNAVASDLLNLDFVRLLVERGADINATDSHKAMVETLIWTMNLRVCLLVFDTALLTSGLFVTRQTQSGSRPTLAPRPTHRCPLRGILGHHARMMAQSLSVRGFLPAPAPYAFLSPRRLAPIPCYCSS